MTFYRLAPNQLSAIQSDPKRMQDLQELAQSSKRRFLCDAYFVNMEGIGADLVSSTHYWYGLFSHQRGSLAWKGMLEVQIESMDDDRTAKEILLSAAAVP